MSAEPASEGSGPAGRVGEEERLRRWRLVLGGADDGTGSRLEGDDTRIDAALAAVYDVAPGPKGRRRQGGLGASAPGVARWLGDIRRYFPASVVQVVQQDAIERLNLRRLLLEPEVLAAVEPDLHLVTTILELSKLLPETSRATARQVVATVVAQLEARLASRARQSVGGALNRAARSRRPRPADIDWHRTIRANLRHYQPELATIVAEKLIGYGRRQPMLPKEIVVAIDQSASMADSVVYAGVYASVLAGLRALKVSAVAFDTDVVDLTPVLHDPVELLFGVQLGGGTDIARAVAYVEQLVSRPTDTIVFLLSDLHEGGPPGEAVARLAALRRRGVVVVVLLALSDAGAPAFDHQTAEALAAEGIPAFAATPDAFPDLVAAALNGAELTRGEAVAGLSPAVPWRPPPGSSRG